MAGQLRLQVISGSPADLTDQAEGLSWSSINPGGDERCTFSLKRKWFAGAPEVAQGNVIQVTDGPRGLWRGRIEENDRAVQDSESIGVTAYGLGQALKDDEDWTGLVVDRDASRWVGSSRARRVSLMGGATPYSVFDPQALPDTAGGLPALSVSHEGDWAFRAYSEANYDAGAGLKVGVVYYDFTLGGYGSGDANLTMKVGVMDDDNHTNETASANLRAASGSGYFTPGTARRYAYIEDIYAAANSTPQPFPMMWRNPTVYGNHGLLRRGSDPGGFYASDVVPWLIGQASGVTVRRVDATTYAIGQLAWLDGNTIEQAVVDATKYDQLDWGTWGPDSILDPGTGGYFDMKAKDTATQHWYCLRSDCDDVSLNVELASLHNAVDVIYRDASGTKQVVTRTATVPALSLIGTRTAKIDGGTLTLAGAQQLGDADLALTAQQPPARGQFVLTAPVSHYQRGKLPPHHMRADGSNIRVPDVLPSSDLFSLSAAPDRRTTFPVKRVSVDASGSVPKATVDVDQGSDTLDKLQARLELAARLAIGQ